MFKQAVIFFFFISLASCSPTQQKSKTALFISIPYIGHINPLLNQAIELYHRRGIDYNIYIISCSNVKTYVETKCVNTTIEFLDIGQCQNETELVATLETIASQHNSLLGVLTLFKGAIEHYYPRMYEQMLNVIQADMFNQQETTIAIIDRITYAGVDIADHFNIPYIINVAGLLSYIVSDEIPRSDDNPSILRDPPQSIHSLGTNLLSRAFAPIVRYLSIIYIYFQYDRPFNHVRETKFQLNNSFHLWSYPHAHLVLVNNAFGLEYAQYLPPNVQLTGPMLSLKHAPDYYITQLSDEDQQWIDADTRPIIYVNFGTRVPLSNEQRHKIFLALKSFDKYRILWKSDQRDLLFESSSTFRTVQWISSTLGHLAHPYVHLFISHCGINSVYESIWLGTAVLCIPILGDQQDMAQRLEDSGVGRWLDKHEFTSEQLKEMIERMFEEEEKRVREKHIRRIQTMMKLHGGIERAVDLIEMTAEFGIQSLIPSHNLYPWYAYYNLDIYAVWLAALIGLRKLIGFCSCCCRRILSTGKSKEKSA